MTRRLDRPDHARPDARRLHLDVVRERNARRGARARLARPAAGRLDEAIYAGSRCPNPISYAPEPRAKERVLGSENAVSRHRRLVLHDRGPRRAPPVGRGPTRGRPCAAARRSRGRSSAVAAARPRALPAVAARNASGEPKCFRIALRRAGPTPRSVSKIDSNERVSRRCRWNPTAKRCASSRTRWSSWSPG